MKRRLFTDADVTPTEALLRKGLGSAMGFYSAVVSRAGAYRKQWQYSRGNGWTLKVDDTRKSLFYLIPLEDGLEISLTVRDSERTQFMGDETLRSLQPQLQGATQYSEGYALRFDVETPAQCTSVLQFLSRLMDIRGSAAPAAPRPKPARKPEAKPSARAGSGTKG